jgi:hypothetical protein
MRTSFEIIAAAGLHRVAALNSRHAVLHQRALSRLMPSNGANRRQDC